MTNLPQPFGEALLFKLSIADLRAVVDALEEMRTKRQNARWVGQLLLVADSELVHIFEVRSRLAVVDIGTE